MIFILFYLSLFPVTEVAEWAPVQCSRPAALRTSLPSSRLLALFCALSAFSIYKSMMIRRPPSVSVSARCRSSKTMCFRVGKQVSFFFKSQKYRIAWLHLTVTQHKNNTLQTRLRYKRQNSNVWIYRNVYRTLIGNPMLKVEEFIWSIEVPVTIRTFCIRKRVSGLFCGV